MIAAMKRRDFITLLGGARRDALAAHRQTVALRQRFLRRWLVWQAMRCKIDQCSASQIHHQRDVGCAADFRELPYFDLRYETPNHVVGCVHLQ
jgi:hypothetical protein